MIKDKSKVFLIFIIIFHCFLFLFLFFFVKKEYHSDEMWLWGIANCKESPHLYRDLNNNNIHLGKWEDAKIFNDYLTVSEDERFDFSIPYRNSLKDVPPLVPFILHFISSLFPGVFSFCFIIPIILISIVASDYFLYNIVVNSGLSSKMAIITVLFFSFSVGGIDTFIFLRHYSFFVMECLMLLYLHMVIYKRGLISNRVISGIIICNIMGVMTHHYYWVFAFILGCYYLIYFLFVKKYKELLKYVITMFSGVIIGFICYPCVLSSFLYWDGEVFGKGYPFNMQLLMAVRIILFQLIGIAPDNGLLYGLRSLGIVFIYAFIVLVPLLIYLHIKGILINIIKYLKKIIGGKIIKFNIFISECGFLSGICILEVIAAVVIVSKTINMFAMQHSTNRYLFYIYPLVIILLIVLLRALFCTFLEKKKAGTLMFITVLFILIFTYCNSWFAYIGKENKEGLTCSDIHNSNIIIILDYPWHMVCLSNIISPDNKLLMLRYEDLDDYMNIIEKADFEKKTYIVSGVDIDNIADDVQADGDNSEMDMKKYKDDTVNESEDQYDNDEENAVLDKWINDHFSQIDKCKNTNYVGKEKTINFHYRVYDLITN